MGGRLLLQIDDIPDGGGGLAAGRGRPIHGLDETGDGAPTRTRLLLLDQGPEAGHGGASSSRLSALASVARASRPVPGAAAAIAAVDVAWDEPALCSRLASVVSGNSSLVRAVGWRQRRSLRVLDCTGGWARDALSLAAMGCGVRVLERDPTVAALLAVAEHLAQRQPPLREPSIARRVGVAEMDAAEALAEYMAGPAAACPDVVLLDPMFDRRGKAAAPSKAAQALRAIAGNGSDDATAELLEAALPLAAAGRCRVVVKLPSSSRVPLPAGTPAPDMTVGGKAVRFDVWLPRG